MIWKNIVPINKKYSQTNGLHSDYHWRSRIITPVYWSRETWVKLPASYAPTLVFIWLYSTLWQLCKVCSWKYFCQVFHADLWLIIDKLLYEWPLRDWRAQHGFRPWHWLVFISFCFGCVICYVCCATMILVWQFHPQARIVSGQIMKCYRYSETIHETYG